MSAGSNSSSPGASSANIVIWFRTNPSLGPPPSSLAVMRTTTEGATLWLSVNLRLIVSPAAKPFEASTSQFSSIRNVLPSSRLTST